MRGTRPHPPAQGTRDRPSVASRAPRPQQQQLSSQSRAAAETRPRSAGDGPALTTTVGDDVEDESDELESDEEGDSDEQSRDSDSNASAPNVSRGAVTGTTGAPPRVAAAAIAAETRVTADVDEEDAGQGAAPSRTVKMRPSGFHLLPSTVYFDYPEGIVGVPGRGDLAVEEPLGKRKLNYETHWERNCIKNAFSRAGFRRSMKQWTALWAQHQGKDVLRGMTCLQKVNHFPSSWCIGRKDRLMQTIGFMARLHGKEHFGFHPEGFVVPQEADALRRLLELPSAASSGGHDNLWICKPVASSCGRGIRVATREQVLALLDAGGSSSSRSAKARTTGSGAAGSVKSRLKKVKKVPRQTLVQRYIADPFLIGGKKFDLRIYVLVTGVDPMRVYVHSQGLTRISTSAYGLSNTRDKYAHLTNYSINKKNDAVFSEAAVDEATGDIDAFSTDSYKWSLIAFRNYLAAETSEAVMLEAFRRIDDMLVKTMIAAESEITPRVYADCNYRSNCYELFGCDVMLDSNLMPHLVEVNISPSLMGTSPLDRRIKDMVVADTFHIVGLYPHDPALLSKFEAADNTSGPASAASSSQSSAREGIANQIFNPFAFNSFSRALAGQDAWRRAPSPANVDLAVCLGAKPETGQGRRAMGNDMDTNLAVATLLLLIEDEFERSKHSAFRLLHPCKDTASDYLRLYRSPRFSDHLIARWVAEGGSSAPALRKLLPQRFLRGACKESKAPSSAATGRQRAAAIPSPSTPGAGAEQLRSATADSPQSGQSSHRARPRRIDPIQSRLQQKQRGSSAVVSHQPDPLS